MTVLGRVLFGVVVLFPVSEVALAAVRRARGGASQDHDRGSLRIVYLGMAVGIGLAVAVSGIPAGRLPGPHWALALAALLLLVVGLAIRWSAILTLGRFFTVNVAIQSDHRVIATGPYRFVRHPSYTGVLVALLGLGVFFGSWMSVLALLVPSVLVILNRVAKEEAALHASLGADYGAYCARTKRFVPGLV